MAARQIPSFAQGYAPRDGPPAYPELHQGHLGFWSGAVGKQGKYRADLSGNHNTGVMANFASINAAEVPGPPQAGGYAVHFDGGDDQIDLARTITLSGAWTWAAWCYVDTGISIICGDDDDNNNNSYLQEGTRWRLRNSAGTTYDWGDDTAFEGVWRHYTMVSDGTGLTAYIDAVSQGRKGAVPSFSINCIGDGYAQNNAYTFDGPIADFSVWSRALRDSEIQDLHTTPNALLQLAPLVYPAAVAGGAFGGRNRIIGGGLVA